MRKLLELSQVASAQDVKLGFGRLEVARFGRVRPSCKKTTLICTCKKSSGRTCSADDLRG